MLFDVAESVVPQALADHVLHTKKKVLLPFHVAPPHLENVALLTDEVIAFVLANDQGDGFLKLHVVLFLQLLSLGEVAVDLAPQCVEGLGLPLVPVRAIIQPHFLLFQQLSALSPFFFG